MWYANINVRPTSFTLVTSVSSNTLACVSVNCISTCPAVHTWIARALIYVYSVKDGCTFSTQRTQTTAMVLAHSNLTGYFSEVL